MMPKRTLIIFSIFILVAIVGGIFIYVYRGFANDLVASYIDKITICGNISEERTCFARSFCEGIYGPATAESDEITFLRCAHIPFGRALEIQTSSRLCEETGGTWYRNSRGNFCLCDSAGPGEMFDKQQGCVIR